jgi:hypothetical protein
MCASTAWLITMSELLSSVASPTTVWPSSFFGGSFGSSIAYSESVSMRALTSTSPDRAVTVAASMNARAELESFVCPLPALTCE